MIDSLACIGRPPEHRDYRATDGLLDPEIAESARVEAFVTVDAGRFEATSIGERTWVMKGCHIAHDCHIGDDCELAPHVCMGGHVVVGDGVKIGLNATIRPRVKIGDGARIGMGAVVTKDVPAHETWIGNPARSTERQITADGIEEWAHWWDRTHASP